VIDAFKVLNPVHMSHRQIGLASWGVVELDFSLQQYRQQRSKGRRTFLPLVDAAVCKQELFSFKLQGSTKWTDRTFRDIWASISWSPSLKLKYPNLLTLTESANV